MISDDEIETLMKSTMTDGYPSDVRRLIEAVQAAERERAKVLIDELNNIINARPREWGEGLRDHFEQWAKNRARAAIAKYQGEK